MEKALIGKKYDLTTYIENPTDAIKEAEVLFYTHEIEQEICQVIQFKDGDDTLLELVLPKRPIPYPQWDVYLSDCVFYPESGVDKQHATTFANGTKVEIFSAFGRLAFSVTRQDGEVYFLLSSHGDDHTYPQWAVKNRSAFYFESPTPLNYIATLSQDGLWVNCHATSESSLVPEHQLKIPFHRTISDMEIMTYLVQMKKFDLIQDWADRVSGETVTAPANKMTFETEHVFDGVFLYRYRENEITAYVGKPMTLLDAVHDRIRFSELSDGERLDLMMYHLSEQGSPTPNTPLYGRDKDREMIKYSIRLFRKFQEDLQEHYECTASL